jgi:dienelactone hydrolase
MKLKSVLTLVILSLLTTPASFSAPINLEETLRPGLTSLFDGRLDRAEYGRIIAEAREFSSLYENKLSKIPSALSKLKLTKKSATLVRFTLPSLVERPGHPSNELIGEIYSPVEPTGCYQNYPATLVLHHIGDDLGAEQTLAKVISGSRRGVVMVIYLPDYGPRRGGDESFIVNDFSRFKMKVLQSLLDTRLAYEVLKRQPQVDTKNMKLMGISLGAMLTLMSAGIDPVFDTYGSLVGGADLAHIMSYRKEADPNSETSLALKDIHWTVDEARKMVASFDALTWAGNVHGKKIVMMNAEEDELIDRHLGVEKIAEVYRSAGNDVKVKLHPGGHRPGRSGMSIWAMLTKIYIPALNFFAEGKEPICDSASQ